MSIVKTLRILVLGLGMLCAAGAWAQQTANPPAIGRNGSGIAWEQLSVEQRELLASMEQQWAQLPPGRQVALATGAKRFLTMDAIRHEQATRRFAQWNAMTDEERAAIAERFAEFRSLPPREKARIRRNALRFNNLSPEQRQRLRQRFQDLPPEERARAREQLRVRPQPPRR